MGVKSNNYQVGLSAVGTQNFNIKTGLDGTFSIYRGNEGAEISEVLKIDSSGNILTSGNLLSGVLGTGQTYRPVSRISGVTYTNTTGKPIIWTFLLNASTTVSFQVDGVTLYGTPVSTGAGVFQMPFILVPDGATYSYTAAGGSLVSHMELRT